MKIKSSTDNAIYIGKIGKTLMVDLIKHCNIIILGESRG